MKRMRSEAACAIPCSGERRRTGTLREMYHEYQWRTSSKSFTEETRDKREIEANAFALAYCRLLSSRCNDSKNEWYKTPEEFGPDVYALSDEYAEKFDLPKSNQAN